jgi:esterase/lipase superfamily enzyme
MPETLLDYDPQRPLEIHYALGGNVSAHCVLLGTTELDDVHSVHVSAGQPAVMRLQAPQAPRLEISVELEGAASERYLLATELRQGRRIPRVRILEGRLPSNGKESLSIALTAIERIGVAHFDRVSAKVPFDESQLHSPRAGLALTEPPEPDDAGRNGADYTVWFGTNRKPEWWSGQVIDFGPDRDEAVRYGQCRVSIPKSHKIGSLGSSALKRLLTQTDDRLTIAGVNLLDADSYWNALAEALKHSLADERDAVVFIHGYNVTFKEAAIRAAQLGFDLSIGGAMAFFSWPSRGRLFSYASDEATIEASEGLISDFLKDIAEKSGASKVHIIAHSMGNRALLRAIDRIAVSASDKAKRPFSQIILAAADVDASTFKRLSVAYESVSQRTTMYVCDKDRAVKASRWLHGYPRVGFAPPVVVVPGVDTIRVADIDLTMLGHGYFAEARALLTDMHQVLKNDTAPEKRFALRRTPATDGHYWVLRA